MKRLSDRERSTIHVIAQRGDLGMTIQDICKVAKISNPTAWRVTSGLVSQGLLSVEQEDTGGRPRCRYTVTAAGRKTWATHVRADLNRINKELTMAVGAKRS